MISIATRLRPFSHRAGAQCIVPGTDQVIEAFPHLLRIGTLEIPLGSDPFVPDFTLQQDLERNCVWVFGKKFRIKIVARSDGFEVGTKFFPAPIRFHKCVDIERLSLGSHKAQDWDLVLRRFDLKEILPALYDLGQKVPFSKEIETTPMSLEDLYRSSFHHMMVPRNKEESGSVLRSAFLRIRSLFIVEKANRLQLLPDNPFPEGRLVNVQTEMASLDIEWTKRRLRRVTLHMRKTGEMFLDLPKEILSFRGKGMHMAGEPLQCVAGQRMVFLDRFYT